MTGYRRFVAYIYEYQKGKKAANCGFVRVEVRERNCSMEFHIRCAGLIADTKCRIYGFVRNRGLMDGSLLGGCTTEADSLEYMLETDCENMGREGISLDDMAGLILTTENGGFFGTEWDDQPIRPENFRYVEKTAEKKADKEEKKETGEEILKEPEKQEENTTESKKETEKIISDKQREETSDTIGPESEEAGEIPDRELHTQSLEPQPRILPGMPWEAFDDGELTECRKIKPDDLRCLGRRVCMLRNNRFVQHGYYNFGHLLLCRNNTGKIILGVPGCYDQQEQFMAGMFGFPCFKESKKISLQKRKGGYWYRSVDSPDFH